MLKIKSQSFLTGEELSTEELVELLKLAGELKRHRSHKNPSILEGKTLALIFEKPSLRTRLSFTVGIQELGGRVIELLGNQKKSEEPEDSMRVLQSMVHGVMLRTFDHSILDRMVSVAKVPVINGLSDSHHPCQALADVLTLKERFHDLEGLKLAYVGDGNNVLHSLLLVAPRLGIDVHFSCPRGFEPDPVILERAQAGASPAHGQVQKFLSPLESVKGVHAIYTDVWTSMGSEAESDQRKTAFVGYQVNQKLLSEADPSAVLMHCLPMLRGQEITSEMADHERSAIFQQAENRLHAQKALLVGMFSPRI